MAMPTNRVLNTIRSLSVLPKTTVSADDDFRNIYIEHANEFVPDFHFVWSETSGHYRVYIKIANGNQSKTRAGYNICVVKNSLAASAFVMLYSFLHRNRGNKKD